MTVGQAALLMLTVAGLPQEDQSVLPPGQRYRINVDYHLARSPETLMWAAFMVDHDKWPLATQIGISRTGLVLVLEWRADHRARMTHLRLWPHEVREWFDLVEAKVKFCGVKSVAQGKDDPYYLYGNLGYALPSRSEATCLVYRDGAAAVEPIMERLRGIMSATKEAWVNRQEGSGPAGVFLETENFDWLPQFMAVLHENETLQQAKRPTLK